jgi:hypothetical protein
MVQIWIHNTFIQTHKQYSFSMSKLSSCERNSFKSFINILKANRLDQQKSNNIERVENCRSKTQVVLIDQEEQKGHLRIAKEEPQKVDQQNPNIKLTKEELQELEYQRSNPNVMKEKQKTKI